MINIIYKKMTWMLLFFISLLLINCDFIGNKLEDIPNSEKSSLCSIENNSEMHISFNGLPEQVYYNEPDDLCTPNLFAILDKENTQIQIKHRTLSFDIWIIVDSITDGNFPVGHDPLVSISYTTNQCYLSLEGDGTLLLNYSRIPGYVWGLYIGVLTNTSALPEIEKITFEIDFNIKLYEPEVILPVLPH
ncbi:MAG: hypothetical protein MJB14_09410 [Spirochaetes bacterium]|nr:hypothetical protein [Spirochaetota bacterium]